MDIAINLKFYSNYIGMEKAAKYVADAGFAHLDYTPSLLDDNWEKVMKESAKIFEANGLTVHQTHAPFNRYGTYGDKHKLCMDRCMEATSFFGAKYVAVHGDEFDLDNLVYSDDAAFEYNHNYFKPYVEHAEKNGFKMAFETVFEDSFKKCRRYTSAADELLGLIKSYNSDSAVCCWDFGHANVSFGKAQADEVRKFGSLIQCTHLHDNTGNDSHQMPMSGDINWQEVMKAFGEIGYSDVMSVEYAHGSMPEKFIPQYLKLSYEVTKHLCSMM